MCWFESSEGDSTSGEIVYNSAKKTKFFNRVRSMLTEYGKTVNRRQIGLHGTFQFIPFSLFQKASDNNWFDTPKYRSRVRNQHICRSSAWRCARRGRTISLISAIIVHRVWCSRACRSGDSLRFFGKCYMRNQALIKFLRPAMERDNL